MRSILIKVIAGVSAVLGGGLAVEGATLAEWQRTGSSFDFRLGCEPSATYLIQQSTNLMTWQTIVRSGSGSSNRLLQIPASTGAPANLFFRALRTNEPLFGFALTARRGIDLFGNDLSVDSFDSTNPAYSTNGRWDIAKRRDHGDVASGDIITNNLGVGSVEIFGRLHIGPVGMTDIGPNGKVGSLAWHFNGNAHGIQPGYITDDTNLEFPDAILPATSWGAMPSGGTVNGTNYDYIFSQPGNYRLPAGAGALAGKILVWGVDVRLRVDTDINLTGDDRIELVRTVSTNVFNAPSLTLYMNGTNAHFGGGGVPPPGGPAFVYFGSEHNISLMIDAQGEVGGAFYAPFADVAIGGGTNYTDFSGAVVGNSIQLQGHLSLHFDESLLRTGPKN